ncbi:hypothetical protein BDR26DRAFT_238852 [Obelidium mucronatum]|nr:hypothetical protein BDR26DRAFT_238852 [Obelidium mucronatum]
MMELYVLSDTYQTAYRSTLDARTPSTATTILQETASLEPTTVPSPDLTVSITIDYNCPDGKFFTQDLPEDLIHYIPAPEFHARMQGINQALRKYISIRDYSPIIRLFIFIMLTLYSIVIVIIFGGNAMHAWGLIAGGAAIGVAVVLITYCKKRYCNFIESEMKRFTELDKMIGLEWESVRNVEATNSMYHIDFEIAKTPWDLIIRRARRSDEYVRARDGAGCEDSEFLPCYSADVHDGDDTLEFLVASVENDSTRAPSYKSRV